MGTTVKMKKKWGCVCLHFWLLWRCRSIDDSAAGDARLNRKWQIRLFIILDPLCLLCPASSAFSRRRRSSRDRIIRRVSRQASLAWMVGLVEAEEVEVWRQGDWNDFGEVLNWHARSVVKFRWHTNITCPNDIFLLRTSPPPHGIMLGHRSVEIIPAAAGYIHSN